MEVNRSKARWESVVLQLGRGEVIRNFYII